MRSFQCRACQRMGRVRVSRFNWTSTAPIKLIKCSFCKVEAKSGGNCCFFTCAIVVTLAACALLFTPMPGDEVMEEGFNWEQLKTPKNLTIIGMAVVVGYILRTAMMLRKYEIAEWVASCDETVGRMPMSRAHQHETVSSCETASSRLYGCESVSSCQPPPLPWDHSMRPTVPSARNRPGEDPGSFTLTIKSPGPLQHQPSPVTVVVDPRALTLPRSTRALPQMVPMDYSHRSGYRTLGSPYVGGSVRDEASALPAPLPGHLPVSTLPRCRPALQALEPADYRSRSEYPGFAELGSERADPFDSEREDDILSSLFIRDGSLLRDEYDSPV